MSNNTESMQILESVQRIRTREQTLKKKYPLDGKLTYWDADEARHLLYFSGIVLKTSFGEEVVLTGNPYYQDDNRLVFDVDAVVAFQFLTIDNIKSLMPIFKNLRSGNGVVDIGKFEGIEELEFIARFCSRMDDYVREEANKLSALGVREIFQKIWYEMGGDMIRKEDALGKRICFFRELVTKYKANKVRWRSEMLRMKLVS